MSALNYVWLQHMDSTNSVAWTFIHVLSNGSLHTSQCMPKDKKFMTKQPCLLTLAGFRLHSWRTRATGRTATTLKLFASAARIDGLDVVTNVRWGLLRLHCLSPFAVPCRFEAAFHSAHSESLQVLLPLGQQWLGIFVSFLIFLYQTEPFEMLLAV